jgi:hypothetical protein
MSNIKEHLRLIMEGSILNEGDVVDLNLHIKEKKYQEELHKLQGEFNNFIDDLAQTIAVLTRKKDSGAITNEEYMAKMGELESRRPVMLNYTKQIADITQQLDVIRKNKKH